MSPFLLPPNSPIPSIPGDESRARCTLLAASAGRMSEDELTEHLSTHAETCDDPRWAFSVCQVCAPLRRAYFEGALETPTGDFCYWQEGRLHEHVPAGSEDSDGLITLAYVELPNEETWAEIRTHGADEVAPAAVSSFEELHPCRDVKWFFNAKDTRWLGDQEVSRHRRGATEVAAPTVTGPG